MRKRKCYEAQPPSCKKCDMEDEQDEKEQERDMELQDKRLKAQVKHKMDIADLDMQIRKIREEVEDKRMAEERARALEQKKRDLNAYQLQAAEALRQASQKDPQKASLAISSNPTRPHPITTLSTNHNDGKLPQMPNTAGQKTSDTSGPTPAKSASELEWERQKNIDGASNQAIDDLMALTGLEEVKEKFLDIKAKIETVARQGIDMKKERMGMVMLGNPGTGMVRYRT